MAGGPGAIYLDPENEQEMFDHLTKILADNDLRKKMIEEGHKHIKQFEPAVIAKQITTVYAQA